MQEVEPSEQAIQTHTRAGGPWFREKAKVDLTKVVRGWRGRERDEEAKPGWVTPRRACLGLRCGSVWSVCVRLGEGPGLRTKTLGAPTATSAKAALVRKPVCRSRASAP